MKAERFQSLCASVLLAGLLLTGLGGLGMYYFGSKSAEEKEQRLNDEISSQKQTLVSPTPALLPPGTPRPAPVPLLATPIATPPGNKTTPALAAPESGSTASPATPAAKMETSLTDKQRKEIVDSLRKHDGKITICSAESDTAGLAFANTLKRAFEEAGWQVDGVKQIAFAKPPVGLNLACGTYPTPDALVAVYRAFAGAGLHVSQQLDTKLAGTQVQLIVGSTLQN